MSFLFLTSLNDDHCETVANVLNDSVDQCTILRDEDYPWNVAFSIDPLGPSFLGSNVDGRFPIHKVRVIWNRRASHCALPDMLHPDDAMVVRNACDNFLSDLRILDPRFFGNAIWVNDHAAQLRMEAKANQLQLAQAVGFAVPPTLLSNDPVVIRAFLSTHSRCIVKPLRLMIWNEDEGVLAVPTSQIVDGLELDDDSLRICPMIYQAEIQRRCDLRVIVFGDYVEAVEIVPKVQRENWVDWRPEDLNDSHIGRFPLKVEVRAQILAFCKAAKLSHAVFDFGVEPDGQAVFFECNSQGKWLWIERANPEIRLLDAFVRFLSDAAGLKVRQQRFTLANYAAI